MSMSTARKVLRRLWTDAKIESCADGTVKITPKWRGIRPWNEDDGGGPGVLTRMYSARMVADVLNIRGKK